MREYTKSALIRYLEQYIILEDQQVLLLESYMEQVYLQRNEWLIREGDYRDHIYFLENGLVRTVADQADRDVTVWVTLPNHFLSSAYSFVKKKPSLVGLQAIRRSELVRIPRTALKELYQQIPLIKDVTLNIMNEYYVDLERLYIFCLSHSAKQRYTSFHANFPEHFLKVPLKYLASMIHVKPETLSRIRRIQGNSGLNLGTD